jgi:NAD(P)-dependent dehydrogenase (short-subunit alcohol dehydrogenase family)
MQNSAIYPSLKDRTVFVTGGGGGIGASIVEHFCHQGARVAFVDIDEAGSRALAGRIAASGDPVPLFLPCDLRDIPALRSTIAQTAEALGPIRILINNAAHDERHAIDEVTPEYWDDRMAVNLRHQFFAVQAVHKGMAEAGGGAPPAPIKTISSTAAGSNKWHRARSSPALRGFPPAPAPECRCRRRRPRPG